MKPSSRHAHERDAQPLVSHIERGARRALGVARREWRGALATLVIVAFLWQTFASSGVAFAISETAGDVAHTVMVNADGAGDTTAPAGGTETPGDGQQPSIPSEPIEPAGSSDDPEPGTPDTTTVPTGTESDSATTQQGGSTLTSQNTTPATEAEEDAPEGEPTGTVTPADDESTDEPRAVEAWDWTGRAQNLELSSPDGLAIDEEEVRAHVAEQLAALAADDEAAATDAEGTATDEGTEPADDPTPTDDPAPAEDVLTEAEVRALLPAELPATLDLAAELDPAANAETGDHSVIMPGDRFTVNLPEGIVLASTEAFDIYQLDANGNETVIRIATAEPAADGTVEIAGAAGGALAPTDGSGTYTATHDDGTGIALITVADTPAELTVVKAAGADGGKVYLAGAEFTLTEVLPDGSTGEPQVISGITGDDGSVVLAGLKAGSRYVLAETVAPAGYELLTDTLTFDVAADGTITVVGNTPDGFTVGAAHDSVEVLDRVLGISLVKTGTDGQALAGAEFTLEPVEGTFPDGSAVKTFTSDEFGAVFTDLQLAGSPESRAYALTETVPPVGYRAMDPVTILVYEDGTVALDGETPEDAAALVQIDNAGETPVVSVAGELVQVDLTKVSTGGAALAGAEFRIAGTFADGTAERTVTVGEDGTAALEGLVAGETYTLTETVVPEGYELIEGDFAFTVALDGTVSGETTSAAGLLGQRSAGYYVADDGLAVIAVDEPTPLLDRLTSTGDLLPMAGYLLASGALLIVAGELRRRRKAR